MKNRNIKFNILKKNKTIKNKKNINSTTTNKFFKFFKKNIYLVIVLIIVILVLLYILWYKNKESIEVYEANVGDYEISTEAKGYILNKETFVDYDKNETLIPVAESKKRITIGSVIGIYKNKEYDEELAKLNMLDAEINEKLKLLPKVYSNDVILIDKEIDYITKQVKSISSYIQMGDLKTKLDELTYQKALTVSSLTPSGSDVKSLILQRDEYKENMNNSSNNVKAPISGIVLYKKDGLENKYNLDDIDSLSKDALDLVIEDYDKIYDETFGIKIVNNYESYIVIKEDKVNEEYIKENEIYEIELLDKNTKIKGLLVKFIVDDNYNYCIFKISNNIEEIVDLRKTDVRVIWEKVEGFVVDNSSIKYVDDIEYITILTFNKYIDIPIKTLFKLEHVSLVENYSNDEKEQLNLNNIGKLEIYDRVVEYKE